jgi:Tol biopolymer transport system component
VYVRNRVTQRTRLVSVDDHNRPLDQFCRAPSISSDGRLVAFATVNRDGSSWQIRLRNWPHHHTRLISVSLGGGPGNHASYLPDVAANARTVAFYSDDSNLVRHDTNQRTDVFVRQLR